MTIENLAIIKAAGAKMKYLSTRQEVISQNIAHADTPGYVPHDVSPLKFNKVLARVSGESELQVSTPDMGHMPPRGEMGRTKEGEQRSTYEVTPSGNAVNIEEQLVNSNKVQMDYNMMLNLYRKQVNMMKIAIGKQPQ